MVSADKRAIVRTVLARHPRSHAEGLGIAVARNKPMPLYQWLLVSLLFSARIGAGQAEKAARALFRKGWRTAHRMAATEWEAKVRVLNRAGYARYDESTARYIGDATELLVTRYEGDLRRLREAAKRDPAQERRLLTQFKGVGAVGVDIFFREAQLAWDELYPFADAKALESASALGLGDSPEALAELVETRAELPRLLSGLVRVSLEGETESVLAEAA